MSTSTPFFPYLKNHRYMHRISVHFKCLQFESGPLVSQLLRKSPLSTAGGGLFMEDQRGTLE